MNCDPLARIYRTLEHLAFGTRLERQRFQLLGEAGGVQRALLLGEGDGRFLLRLAELNANVEIDCIDLSRKMIETARQRVRSAKVANPDRIRFHQMDARAGRWPGNRYDLIATNFLFDCFSTVETDRLIPAIRGACRPGAKWLIAEFQVPRRGWRHWHARLWLAVMYWFFRMTTGLQIRRLPNYRPALSKAGFVLRTSRTAMAQLTSAELWELPAGS